MKRTFLAVAVVVAVAGIGVFLLAPLGWALLLGLVFGLFALLALVALSYRDPHRHLDASSAEGSPTD